MRYLVNVGTEYAGSDKFYKIQSDDIKLVTSLAEERALENGIETGLQEDIEYDNPNLTEEELTELFDQSYYYHINEFDGTEEEWELYEDL